MGSSMTSRSSRKRERRRARPPSQKARADPSNVCVQFSGLPTPERIEECAGIVRRLGSTVCEPGYDVEVTHLVLPEVAKASSPRLSRGRRLGTRVPWFYRPSCLCSMGSPYKQNLIDGLETRVLLWVPPEYPLRPRD